VLNYSVAENLILGVQNKQDVTGGRILNLRRILARARRLIGAFDIRGASPPTSSRSLSGGNQQKVVLARELDCRPKLLIASQPTRGLDIGAIQFVHEQLLAERDRGVAILLVSAELDEILALSDRISVLYEGHITGTFMAEEATEEQLGTLMTGGTLPSAAAPAAPAPA
jgi:simple sugar transport system ATP-binding protein